MTALLTVEEIENLSLRTAFPSADDAAIHYRLCATARVGARAADAIDKEIRLLQRLLPRQWPDNLREMVALKESILTATTEGK